MAAQGGLSEEGFKLYRVRKTICKMLANRKYLVAPEEIEMSTAQFKHKFEAGGADSLVRENLTMLAQKVENANDQIFVFFPEEETLGVKPIRTYTERMKAQMVGRAIIVVKTGITAHARTALLEMGDNYQVEHFKESELLIDITEHSLVPKHVVLTPAEKKELLEKYTLKENQLPRIQEGDPVARYFGIKRGEVVKIIRPSETAGRYVTYRIVF